MAEVGSAFVSLLPSARGFGAKLNQQVGGDVKSSGATLGKTFGLALAAAAGAVVAGGAILGKFTKDAAVLDTSMREVVTLFGETGKAADRSLGKIQGQVKSLSNEFGIAQETLTSGLYSAISAGVPRENAFTFMQVASKAAIGGVTDVETAVDGISSTINAFGLKAADAAKVADSMFTAVKGGKTTFGELSGALFNVAPAAAAAGVSFREVNAAIAALTAGGTPTSVATTQIRAALTGLQAPSEELDAIFGKLGFKNAQLAIESKGLGFALDAVKKASKGNNGELQKLLGSSEAVAAANVLAGTGAAKFTAEMKAQRKSAGATEAAFKVVNDGAQRQFEIFKTNLRNVGLSVGQALLPGVTAVLKFINNDLGPAFERLKVFVAPAIAAIKSVFASFTSGSGASGLMDTFKSIGAAAIGLAAPLAATAKSLGAFFAGLLPTLQKFAGQLAAVIGPAVREIGALVATQLLPAFRALLPILLPVAKFLLNIFGGAVVGVIKGFVQVLKGVINVIAGIFKLVVALVQGDWAAAWAAVVQIAKGAFSAVLGAIKVWLYVGVLGLFRKGAALLKGLWSGLWSGIKSVAASAAGAARNLISRMITGIGRLFVKGVKTYLNMWRSLFRGLLDLARSGWKVLRSAFGSALAAIRTVVAQAMSKVRSAFSSAWNAIKSGAKSAFGNIVSTIRSGIGKAVGLVRGLPGKAKAALGNLGRTLYNAGAALIQGLINGIQSKIAAVAAKMRELAGKVKAFLPGSPVKEGPLTSWNNGGAGKRLVGLLADGLEDTRAVDAAMDRLSARVAVKAPHLSSSLTSGGPVAARTGGSVVQNIYETSDPRVTARESARQLAFAGVV